MSTRHGPLLLTACLVLALPEVRGAPSSASARPSHTDARGDPLPRHALARLGMLRFRHGDYVCLVAFLPGDKTVLSVGGHLARIWDRSSGKELRHFGADRWDCREAALSPDRRILACSYNEDENGIGLYDVASGRELRWLRRGHTILGSPVFSPDGRILATSWDRIRLWNVATGELLHEFAKTKEVLFGMVFSPDGKTLISTGFDGKLRWWDVASGRLLREVQGARKSTPFLVRSPDGSRLASASYDGFVTVWDTRAGKTRLDLEIGSDWDGCPTVAFSPDGKRLAAGGGDRMIHVWDAATGRELRRLGRHHGCIWGLSFAADGKSLISGGRDGTVRLWNLATGRELVPVPGGQNRVHVLALSPNGKTLAAGGDGPFIQLWNLTGAPKARTLHEHRRRLAFLAFSPDGKVLTVVGRNAPYQRDHTVWRWDVATGARQNEFETTSYPVALSADGRRLAASSAENLELVDTATGKKERAYPCAELGRFLEGVFSRDNKFLYTSNLAEASPGPVYRWGLATGKREMRRGNREHFWPHELTISANGRVLAALEDGQGLYLWRWPSGELLRKIVWGENRLVPWRYNQWRAFALSPDGRTLALGGYDSAISLRETATGQERAVLRGHRGSVQSLLFSPDGRRLYSGGYDTTVLVWDLTGRAGRPPAALLSARAADECWRDLAGADAARAYRAVGALTSAPAAAIPLLRSRLGVRTTSTERVARLVTDLDSDDFPTRDAASRELRDLGEYAAPALRRALEGKPTLEVRRRVELLLELLEQARRNPQGDRLRGLRGLEVLEAIGTPKARRVLEHLARGFPAAQLTQEAKLILEYQARKPGGRP